MAQYPMYNYGNPYGYQQPMMNYQPMDRLAQIQQNYAQTVPANYQQAQIPQQPIMGLNGEIVDSIDVVKAKNVDMSGNPTFYPKSDLSEIYIKRLQPDGTSRVMTYKLLQDTAEDTQGQSVTPDILNSMFGQLRQDLLSEINGVKDLVGTLMSAAAATSSSKSAKGGSKE